VVSAADKDDAKFELIPEAENNYTDDVRDLGDVKSSGNFAEIYNQKAKSFGEEDDDGVGIKACSGLGEQFASGIMNRDTILCLAAQVVSFVSNMALVV